jgi:5-methylcytosine-specific restriction endonuclease McrA
MRNFYKHSSKRDGHQNYCKDCDKVYKRSRTGKESQMRADKKRNGSKNRKQYRRSRKGKLAIRRYLQSTKGKQACKKRAITRRTRKSQSGGTYTADEWYRLCEFYEFYCLKCNKKFPFEKLTLDHIKPVSRGGTSFISNAQPLCKCCNSSKGIKEIDYRQTLPDWLKRDDPAWQQNKLFRRK